MKCVHRFTEYNRHGSAVVGIDTIFIGYITYSMALFLSLFKIDQYCGIFSILKTLCRIEIVN